MSDDKVVNVNFDREITITKERIKEISNALTDISVKYTGETVEMPEAKFFMELLGSSIVGFAKLHATTAKFLNSEKTIEEQADELVFIYRNMLTTFLLNNEIGDVTLVV